MAVIISRRFSYCPNFATTPLGSSPRGGEGALFSRYPGAISTNEDDSKVTRTREHFPGTPSLVIPHTQRCDHSIWRSM